MRQFGEEIMGMDFNKSIQTQEWKDIPVDPPILNHEFMKELNEM